MTFVITVDFDHCWYNVCVLFHTPKIRTNLPLTYPKTIILGKIFICH